MKDLLTIPEFVELSGKKKQGIYQQIKNENSRLFEYVVKQGGKTFIKAEALNFYKEDSPADSQGESQAQSQTSQSESKAESQDSQAASQESKTDSQSQSKTDSQTQSIIDFLQEQIREKDKQLAEKDKQIERIQKLLDQEQQLHLQANLLLLGEGKQAEEQSPDNIVMDSQEEHQEPKKKRNWFARWLFGEE